MTYLHTIRCGLAAAGVAAALAASYSSANAVTTVRACPSGLYGLGGDWGPGSLRADTPANRAWVRSRHGRVAAYRIIHNVRPIWCA